MNLNVNEKSAIKLHERYNQNGVCLGKRLPMDEHQELGKELLPQKILMSVSATYTEIAKTITGQDIQISDTPRDEIIAILKE